jgi:hypothetical protein
MGLYQITEFDYPAPLNQFTLPPGVLGVIPLVLESDATLTLTMNQLQPNPIRLVQDRSILGWVSTQQSGNPVIDNPASLANWHLTSLQKTIIILYDALSELGPFDQPAISLMPGSYWLNVLNLVNETNSFFLEITGA